MHNLTRFALILPFVWLTACDELAVADDPAALADLRGQKSCVAAVKNETGAPNVAINTTLPIVEINRFIVDTDTAGRWTCVTNNAGQATEIVQRQTG